MARPSASGGGVDELAAQRDSLGRVPQGDVEFVSLVGDLGQPRIARTGGWRRPAGRDQAAQDLLAGQRSRVQLALGELDQHQLVAAPSDQRQLAGLTPPGEAGRQGAFGLGESAAQPFGHGQESVRRGAQRPFFWLALGQGLRGERGRGLGIAVELGEIAAVQRGHGRDIDQEAGRRAAGWLERLIGPARGRAVNRVQQRFHDLGVATVGGQVGLR